ncbi:MAG: DUF2141 domain-containing protein [Flavobacteriales bacterium]
MKYFVIVCLFGLLSSLAKPKPTDSKFDLQVTVSAVASAKGWIEFALYRNPDTFAKVGTTYRLARADAQKGVVNYTFKDLESGKYAVVVYHDVNQNKICDKNFFGVPTEGYAFSNNVRPNLSVPSFEDCSFKFQQDRNINIKMVY